MSLGAHTRIRRLAAARCQLPERRARHPAFHTSPAAQRESSDHLVVGELSFMSPADCKLWPAARPCGEAGRCVSGQAHKTKQQVVGRYAQGGRGRGASLLEGFPLGPQLPQLPLVAAAAQEVDVLRRPGSARRPGTVLKHGGRGRRRRGGDAGHSQDAPSGIAERDIA